MQHLNFAIKLFRNSQYVKGSSLLKHSWFNHPQLYNNGNFIKAQFCSKVVTRKCWNCGSIKTISTDLLCPNCNAIQYPNETRNFFELFNIVEDFDVDQKSLTAIYRRYQTVLHPDKFSNKSDEEKNISLNYSALVNEAYNTLQTPLKRAIHMLQLHGENIDEDQKITEPELLREIMELNEEVEAAVSPDDLRHLNAKNKKELEEIGKTIANCFKANNVKQAKENIIKMKYFNSVSLHINSLLRERGIVD